GDGDAEDRAGVALEGLDERNRHVEQGREAPLQRVGERGRPESVVAGENVADRVLARVLLAVDADEHVLAHHASSLRVAYRARKVRSVRFGLQPTMRAGSGSTSR